MEGAGNDYVYVNGVQQAFTAADAERVVRRVADRHFGVGGDGLILLQASAVADVRMCMWNNDGSRGRMCGNGLRCVAKLAHDDGLVAGPRVVVETEAGLRAVELLFAAGATGGTVVGARADMGPVRVDPPVRVRVDGCEWVVHPGDAGNPHAVIFVATAVDAAPVELVGRALQDVAQFPGGVNVEFVAVEPDGSLRQRTFERGAGETLACGSGATIAALAAVQTGRVPGPTVRVHLRGGSLTIHVLPDQVVMEGPAREVFRGEIDLGAFAPR
jgi:diaminopimelate epimerase